MQPHPREIATNWLSQATRDLDNARYLSQGGRYEAACFACQQAAEKALTSALIWLAGDRPRTHEIGVLLAEIASHRSDVSSLLADVVALDPYYVTTRYPDAVGGGVPGAKFFAPETDLALERATRAVSFAQSVVPQ